MGESCVVIFNRNSPIWLRHIITIPSNSYNPSNFKAWYYEEYLDFDGDEFVYCHTRKERDELIEWIKKEEDNEYNRTKKV